MARPKTIYVNSDEMLAAIHACHEADLAEAAELVNSTIGTYGSHANAVRWDHQRLEQDGLEIDFERFARRALTASERIRHQECLRDLERGGAVRIYGVKATRVLVMPVGLARLAAIQQE
jgi:hypothetical protein